MLSIYNILCDLLLTVVQVSSTLINIKPKLCFINTINMSPGGLLSPKSYVDVPAEPRKSDFLYTNFSPNYPPISIPFSIEKHPILPKLGAF